MQGTQQDYDKLIASYKAVLNTIKLHEKSMSSEAVISVYRCRKLKGLQMPAYIDREEFNKRCELDRLLDIAESIRSSAVGFEVINESKKTKLMSWFKGVLGVDTTD